MRLDHLLSKDFVQPCVVSEWMQCFLGLFGTEPSNVCHGGLCACRGCCHGLLWVVGVQHAVGFLDVMPVTASARARLFWFGVCGLLVWWL